MAIVGGTWQPGDGNSEDAGFGYLPMNFDHILDTVAANEHILLEPRHLPLMQTQSGAGRAKYHLCGRRG